jgi:pimeloyl-ACP methyl ester carboxylesterase
MIAELLLTALASATAQAGAPAPAAPARSCVTATPDCTEWVALGPGPWRSLVYRSYPLDKRHDGIRRALVVVHGQGRNADGYFRTGVAAAFLAGALDDTVVVSLRFASNQGTCQDQLAEHEVNWPCGGVSWRAGGVAVSSAGPPPGPRAGDALTSYDLADAVLRKLARREVFPNLRGIVVTGHSAGGQFVSRYAMSNVVHETLGVPVTYVVSNPSSYGYPGPDRPSAGAEGFAPYEDARNCTAYNRWPYGFEGRSGYAASLTDEQLKRQLVSRPTVYLLGELDTTPLAGFDGSCPAMAQGPNRLERGQAFVKYVNERLGGGHVLIAVPLCGHNARCVFTSDVALPVLFPAAAP